MKIFSNDKKPSIQKTLLLIIIGIAVAAVFLYEMMSSIDGNDLTMAVLFSLISLGGVTFAFFSFLDFLILPE